MLSRIDLLEATGELLKVRLFRRPEWMRLEERNDRLQELRSSANEVLMEVFRVVVVPTVHVDPANPEELTELFEAARATSTLRYYKPVEDLKAGSVASSPHPAWLPNETD